jgi:hypothetical protein
MLQLMKPYQKCIKCNSRFDEAGMLGDETLRRKIILHYKLVSIDEDNVKVANDIGQELSIVGHEYSLEKEFYVIHIGQERNFSILSRVTADSNMLYCLSVKLWTCEQCSNMACTNSGPFREH